MCYASDNHDYMCHTCAKEFSNAMLQIITIICVTHVQKNFQIPASVKQLLTKYQIFTKLTKIPHIHINRNFSSIFATF